MSRRGWVDNRLAVRFGFREKYLTVDPRALGVGRIVLGTVLLLDLARRLPFATLWYSNDGLLPNHTVLWRPTCPYVFSLFFTASRAYEAMIGFALCAAVYLMLLFGYKTRLAQVGSLLAVISLHGRVLFIQNSGDVVLVELCVWTCFLPLGRRYSIDALRACVRADPRFEGPGCSAQAPVASWAVLAIVVQLAVIYVVSAAEKWGPTWRQGTAVHYVLYYANVVTPLGVWLRDVLTPRASQMLSWSTRFGEGVIPLLLLTPIGRRPARWLAIVMIVALHVGFGLFLNLGIFVPAMLAFTPFLVPASDWQRLEELWASSSLGRAGRRLLIRNLDLVRGQVSEAPPAPVGSLATSDVGTRLLGGRRRALAREAAVVTLMVVATCGVVFDNSDLTHASPEAEPGLPRAILGYLQMFQVWGMFTPDVPTSEATVAVDAVTADGRHVDPLNEVLSPGHPWRTEEIPPSLGNNGFASAYLLRIPTSPDYFTALGDWLLKYPERTQRAADRVVSFRVFTVEQADPPPGQRHSGKARWDLLFQYPSR